MAVTVRVPTQLRSLTQGQAELDAVGVTVGEVIDDLDKRFPGVAARVLDDGGKVRRFVNVYVDEDDVRFLDGLDTAVSSDSCVSIIPAVAGG